MTKKQRFNFYKEMRKAYDTDYSSAQCSFSEATGKNYDKYSSYRAYQKAIKSRNDEAQLKRDIKWTKENVTCYEDLPKSFLQKLVSVFK